MTFDTLPFPSRPVAATRNVFSPPRGFVFTIIILGALAGFLGWWQAPGLIRDLQINQNPIVLYDGDIIGGECSTRRGITDCEAQLVYSYEGKDYDTRVSMAFIDFHSGDYEVDLVISGDKPELATMSLGLEMLWNRLAVFGVFMLIFVGGFIAMLFKTLQALSANGKARRPSPARLVPVELSAVHNDRGATSVTYIDRLKGPKSKRNSTTRFANGTEPLMTFTEDGQWMGVAMAQAGGGLPVLLDAGLERVDLLPEERNALLASVAVINERFAAQPAEAAAPQKKGKNPALRGILTFVLVLLLCAIGALGYWVYYVTSGPDAFDDVGMEINNIMPAPLNDWGCEQLQARFGNDRAPYGCVADDFTSWK